MRDVLLAAAAAAAALLMPAAASATSFESISGTRAGNISTSGGLGQSFVALDSVLTSFGFQFTTISSTQTNASLGWSLRQGGGLGGAVISSGTLSLSSTLAARALTWVDIDLGSSAVTIGSTYSLVLSATTARFGIGFGPTSPTAGQTDAYAAGKLLFGTDPDFNGYCGTSGVCDANFRVAGTTAAVPEPASWALMVAGFGLVGVGLRRRQSRATNAIVLLSGDQA